MKTILACIAIIAATGTATAGGSGFFAGGYAEGAARAQELELQERALNSGNSNAYHRLRQQQQLDDIERAIKRNTEALEEANSRRRIRGW